MSDKQIGIHREPKWKSKKSKKKKKWSGEDVWRKKLEISEIIEGKLYLGDIHGMENESKVNDLNIGLIISLANAEHLKTIDGVKYFYINIHDNKDTDVSVHFKKVFNIIEQWKDSACLVACFAGVSRSSSIVISYLMQKNKWKYKKARQFVQSRRKIIHPNAGFAKQLMKFEKDLKLQ